MTNSETTTFKVRGKRHVPVSIIATEMCFLITLIHLSYNMFISIFSVFIPVLQLWFPYLYY